MQKNKFRKSKFTKSLFMLDILIHYSTQSAQHFHSHIIKGKFNRISADLQGGLLAEDKVAKGQSV